MAPFCENRREILIKNIRFSKTYEENAVKEYLCLQITEIYLAILTYKVMATFNEKQVK